MTERRWWRAYVAIFATMAFVSALVTPVAIMTFDNFACRTQPHGSDDFLAYCRSVRYGDYEHGALYYGLSPRYAKASEPRRFYFLAAAGYRLRSLRMPPESISERAASAIS
jgi:hypothetical protein